LIIIIAGWKPLADLNASDKVLNIGFFVLFATGGVDLIRFIVQKYLLSTDQNLSNSLLPLGALVFILFLAMSYLFYVYNRIMDEESQKNLVKLAFHDPLTGLYNRAKWEDLADTFNQSDEDYTIISLDLNGLKNVNDTFGHSRGDLLLTSFANNLKETFDSEDYLIRMGGDEFVVILTGTDYEHREEIVDQLKKDYINFHEQTDIDPWLRFSAAVGMSELKADDDALEVVFRRADRAMYADKEDFKKKYGGYR
jgi:diguanylate cyclase (GGDEF)-like protein